jgi:monoamine oxidase
VGVIEARDRIGGRIGEHVCASGHWGTVHGALQSGLNAAAGILG